MPAVETYTFWRRFFGPKARATDTLLPLATAGFYGRGGYGRAVYGWSR